MALGLHQRLAEARESANLSRRQVAGWLGVHVTNYARIETGDVSISADRVAQLARLLGVSVAWLYGEPEKRAS